MGRIRPQVARVIVVDNSTADDARHRVEACATALLAELVVSGSNEGVAAALNRGIRRARELGFDWVLCFDQDTVAFSTMLHSLIRAYLDCSYRERVGIVGSKWIDDRTHVDPCNGRSWAERKEVITSGSLLPTAAIERAGPFREDFFIDYVDIEWCFRMRAVGLEAIVACPPTMFHWLGAPRNHQVANRNFLATHHDALRRYYITRNRLIVLRGYVRQEPRWVIGDMRNMLKETVKLVLFEKDRKRKLLALLRGMRDGLLGRTGQRPHPHP
jgi:rhamnosyltransferase